MNSCSVFLFSGSSLVPLHCSSSMLSWPSPLCQIHFPRKHSVWWKPSLISKLRDVRRVNQVLQLSWIPHASSLHSNYLCFLEVSFFKKRLFYNEENLWWSNIWQWIAFNASMNRSSQQSDAWSWWKIMLIGWVPNAIFAFDFPQWTTNNERKAKQVKIKSIEAVFIHFPCRIAIINKPITCYDANRTNN